MPICAGQRFFAELAIEIDQLAFGAAAVEHARHARWRRPQNHIRGTPAA
jgi:hypothetical protein